jgi:hypothetical protein
MQIREQGNQVQLIRSPYDKDKKRCVAHVAHTFKIPSDYSMTPDKYLSAEQIADLSVEELAHFDAWLRAKAAKKSAESRAFRISYADRWIGEAVSAIAADGVSSEQAVKIWAAMDAMAKTLKKAGHPKPAKPDAPAKNPKVKKAADPVADSGQADLLDQPSVQVDSPVDAAGD